MDSDLKKSEKENARSVSASLPVVVIHAAGCSSGPTSPTQCQEEEESCLLKTDTFNDHLSEGIGAQGQTKAVCVCVCGDQ